MLLFYLPFILFTFSMFAEAYHHPHKLPQNYDYKIVVEDKANVLGNTAELRNSLVAVRVALRVVFNVTAHVVSTLHDLCTLVCDVVSDNEKRSHNAVFFKLVKHKGELCQC